ncbi:MAG: hypothetical protein AB4352_05405 [Hormoscilla sp.]
MNKMVRYKCDRLYCRLYCSFNPTDGQCLTLAGREYWRSPLRSIFLTTCRELGKPVVQRGRNNQPAGSGFLPCSDIVPDRVAAAAELSQWGEVYGMAGLCKGIYANSGGELMSPEA